MVDQILIYGFNLISLLAFTHEILEINIVRINVSVPVVSNFGDQTSLEIISHRLVLRVWCNVVLDLF